MEIRENSYPSKILESQRFDNHFNLMRLLFAVMVIYSHAYGLLCLEEPIILSRSFGNFAVHCFFVLSGYMITISACRMVSVLDFIYKRILRLAPVYGVATLLCSKIIAPTFHNFDTNPTPYIINGSIWTLSYEIFLYVVCCFMGVFHLLRSEILGGILSMSFVLICVFHNDTSPFFTVLAPMFFLFLCGAYFAVTEAQIKLKAIGPVSIASLLILQFFPAGLDKITALLPWLYAPQFQSSFIRYLVYLLALPPALLYVGKCIPTVKAEHIIMENDISYGAYMYAWPIQQITIFYLIDYMDSVEPVIVFAISVAITLIMSVLSCKFLEQPVLKLKRYSPSRFINPLGSN